MKKTATKVLALFFAVSLLTAAYTVNQVNHERARLEDDLRYRSSIIVEGMRGSLEPGLTARSTDSLQAMVKQYSQSQRIAGLAIVDNTGKIIAASSSLPGDLSQPGSLATNAMDADQAGGELVKNGTTQDYLYASPLHEGKTVVGALLVVQNASYINDALSGIWRDNLLRLFTQIFLLVLAILLVVRWIIYNPIQKLALSLRLMRLDSEGFVPTITTHHPLLRPLLQEVSHIQESMLQAKLAASEEARISLEKLDSPWTAERLKQFTKDILKNRTLILVSNREPYIHTKVGNKIEYHFPASGMVTAVEPVIQATGGTWIATGSGSADKLVVDENDRIQVPPDDPRYTLKRVWLTEEEEKGFYYGFSNQALYPLSHMAHTRPIFNKDDWAQYSIVNQKFARTVLAEIQHLSKPVIFVQDFHFALLPKMIKSARPSATVALFWHIPWISAEAFSICPWKKEILDGMLGADLIGFHTQLHCNNFIETVGRELECLIDFEQFTITRNGHTSLVKPFPASIAFSGAKEVLPISAEETAEHGKLLKKLGIEAEFIGVGVDRLDYIKGVLERLKAIEIFLDRHPDYIGHFAFIQISAPSKNIIPKYLEFTMQVEKEVERVNARFRTKNWKPIHLIKQHHSHKELHAYYRLANFCLITSLHDGMNLVAKEFIAARSDEQGTLILSQYAGAAKDLKDALVINPYSGEETADAIYAALTMPAAEQTKRMRKLRTSVRDYNTYRWSAEILRTIRGLE